MKIVVRGGHNELSRGATGIIDEVIEDRKVYAAVIKYLKMDGNEVLDGTPERCNSGEDLRYGVKIANDSNSDLFVSIHFNNAYNNYNGALGTETLCNLNNSNAVTISERIVENLSELGFKNRGVKDGLNPRRLFEISQTNMNSVIVEVCFVEATEDVNIYEQVGYDKIGKSIAEGIVGHEIKEKQPSEEEIKNQFLYMKNTIKEMSNDLQKLLTRVMYIEEIFKNRR